MAKWIREPSPKDQGARGDGWYYRIDHVYRQGRKYLVMWHTVRTPWGDIKHVCLRNQAGTDVSWAEKQRIKNELFGRESHAIEVFPRMSRLVDEAPMYHLWVLPDTFELPFGIHADDAREA